MILNITKAQYLEEFKVRVWFNDGIEKIVDLKNYINSKNIHFFNHSKKLKSLKNFKFTKL